MIGAPVGVDDEIGDEVRARRLDQDVHAFRLPGPAFGVADDPPHGVTGGHGTRPDELLALLQGDIGYLSRRGVDLIERAHRVGVDLHGVDVAVAGRLHARRLIGFGDAVGRISSVPDRGTAARYRLKLAGKRQRLWDLHNLHRRRRFALEQRRHGIVIVADFWRPEGGAGRECDRRTGGRHSNVRGASAELLRPVDGVDEYPERVLAQSSVSRGVLKTMVRMAVQRSVAASAPSSYRRSTQATRKRGVRGADHARDFDRDLNFADLGEGVVGTGIVVKGRCTLVGGEVIGGEPVLSDDDGISGDGADLLDEAGEVPGDLWIGGL